MRPESRSDMPLHRLVRWLCGRVLPPLAYPVVRGPLRGTRFILRAAAGEGGGASIYMNKVEPAATEALLKVLRPGHVVFDVGANIGYYTILASRRVGPSGRVLAFEPVVRNLSFLYRHVVLNRATNVTVVPMACSDQNALAVLVSGTNCATGHLAGDQPVNSMHGAEYVATVTIDEMVRRTSLAPDIMKIDVEGAEEEVLRGAADTLASAGPAILLSVHSESLRSSCTAFLLALGYDEPSLCSEPWDDAELLFVKASGRHSRLSVDDRA